MFMIYLMYLFYRPVVRPVPVLPKVTVCNTNFTVLCHPHQYVR